MTVGFKDQFAGNGIGNSFFMEADAAWAGSSAKNAYTGDTTSLVGLVRSFDHYDGRGGTDSLNGTSGNDALIYDTTGSAKDPDPAHYVSMELFAMNAGDDVLDLTSGAGGASSYATRASIFGGAGNDVLWAGAGDDTILGEANTVTVAAGADRLVGGAGADTIYGDASTLGAGAAAGDDLLDGGTGSDLLFGDGRSIAGGVPRGHNTFRFDGPGSGRDTIGDAAGNGFQHGLDHLQLSAKYGYTAVQALAHTADNGNGDAVVDLGNNDGITLVGVHKADLTASDFIIA